MLGEIDMKDINVLDYKIEISKDDDGDYIATMPDLGCIADGATMDEAINELIEVANDFIKLAEEDGKLIPEPKRYEEEINYSGKLTLRMPKSLHRMVAEKAQKEESSINQLIMMYISMGLGNEFGKNQVSINLDTSFDMFQKLVSKQWENHVPMNTTVQNGRSIVYDVENIFGDFDQTLGNEIMLNSLEIGR